MDPRISSCLSPAVTGQLLLSRQRLCFSGSSPFAAWARSADHPINSLQCLCYVPQGACTTGARPWAALAVELLMGAASRKHTLWRCPSGLSCTRRWDAWPAGVACPPLRATRYLRWVALMCADVCSGPPGTARCGLTPPRAQENETEGHEGGPQMTPPSARLPLSQACPGSGPQPGSMLAHHQPWSGPPWETYPQCRTRSMLMFCLQIVLWR